MIKIINQRTLHEVISEMRAKGVSLKDTEGFGINMDQSGHTYVVYMAEESEVGVIDTSAGEAGVSGWLSSTVGGTPFKDGANTLIDLEIEVGEMAFEFTESLTQVSNYEWALTLSGSASYTYGPYTFTNMYVKPNTVAISGTGVDDVVDDGLGNLIFQTTTGPKIGTIDYATGVIALKYHGNRHPTGTPQVTYSASPVPNSNVFPKVAAVSHIVFVIDANTAPTLEYKLYNNNYNTSGTLEMPCLFADGIQNKKIAGDAYYYAMAQCDGMISICNEKEVTNRKKRWMVIGSNDKDAKLMAVYVYWSRLSS